MILEHQTLPLPIKWGQATHQTKEFYWYKLESRFIELRLCENHWKAQAIVTRYYPNFVEKYSEKIYAQYGSCHSLALSSTTASNHRSLIFPDQGTSSEKRRREDNFRSTILCKLSSYLVYSRLIAHRRCFDCSHSLACRTNHPFT